MPCISSGEPHMLTWLWVKEFLAEPTNLEAINCREILEKAGGGITQYSVEQLVSPHPIIHPSEIIVPRVRAML